MNRQLRAEGVAEVNHKRVYRIMERNNLLLQPADFDRPERNHDGKVIMMRSNQRWCSDGLEFACSNGEIISWRAVANAGIGGSDVRDMLLEAVQSRFGKHRASQQVEVLSDNVSAYTAKDTRIFAQQLRLESCFTLVKSPQSNGMSEAFVQTLKRDDGRVNPRAQRRNRAVIDRRLDHL